MPVDMKALLQVARAAISDSGHIKNTHPRSPSCAFYKRNEQKRSIFASPPYHGLCVGSDVTDGALLRGPSREPVSGAPTQIVCSRRAVDRAARPDRGRRNCRDWGFCYSSLAGIRRPISGGIAAARRDNRPHTTTERVPYLESWSASHRNKSVTTGVTS